jgi:SpoVK/Ycf46/Vps4 family AAA+-type ATPase
VPVFVAATCNNVRSLPPELIRKDRFDELFFVDLPNQSERKQIFAIHLTRRKRSPVDVDLDRVAAAARGYSGAEIDAAVQTALYAAFSQAQIVAAPGSARTGKGETLLARDLTTQNLLDALAQTVPLSTTRSEEIQALRAWARQRAVPASVADGNAEGA